MEDYVYNMTNQSTPVNGTVITTSKGLQFILNGIFGVLIFTFNVITVISLLICKSLNKKEKMCYLSIITSDTIIGCHTLLVRLIPLEYNSDHVLCHIRMWHGIIMTFLTIFANLMVTTERFLSMAMPLKYSKKITFKTLLLAFFSVWGISFILTFSLFHDGFSGRKSCQFLVVGSRTGYIVTGLIMCTVVLIDFSMYIYILQVTRRHIKQIASTMVAGDGTNTRHLFVKKKERKLTITIGIITYAFGLSYFPMGVHLIYQSIFVHLTPNPQVFTILITFYMSNSLVNPLIYIWRLDSCRKEMINRIMCRPVLTGITTESVVNTTTT